MRAPIRTLSLSAALGGALLLGGCDDSVTSPADLRPSGPEKILFGGGTTWTRTDLPFAPAAINGAGVIVGKNGTEAVRWRNGVVDTLPHRAELAGPYIAVDITPNGLILGAANGHILYWFQDGVQPVDVTSGSPYAGLLYPVAMNDSYTIVAQEYTGLTVLSVRWTYPGPWVDISAPVGISGFDQTVVTSLNGGGQAAGYRYIYNSSTSLPVRWGTTGGPVQLSAPIDANGEPSGSGLSIDGSGNVFGYTSVGATIWHPDGSSALVTGLPARPSLRSDLGRFVGVGSNNGVQQVFTSFNGVLTWLSSPDASAPTPIDVNNCGAIIARRATSPATGSLWRRTSIVYQNTCDQQPVLTASFAM
jgi:hypothetical protein